LEAFATLLEKWTKSINLIAPKTIPYIWDRHILDSAQMFELAPKGWTGWTDLGSGGGLPGVIISILDPENRPVTLVESDQRKCLFLKTVKRELSLNLIVERSRIESVSILPAPILSARALAPLSDLLTFSERVLEQRGIALFAKGENYQTELDHARKSWQFDLLAHPSQTNASARILEISRIRRRES
jgi:16S rRNA (guanine527-N7)-methyltransferase